MKYDVVKLHAFANKIAVAFWDYAKQYWREDIGEMPEIRMNSRLTSTAGRAFLQDNYVDLSCYLLQNNPEYFRIDTIPHELCHHIAFRIYGDRGHGKGWKYVMKSMGLSGDRCHTRQTKYQAERAK
jgi:predicted SprT family Zn-dependent metalloprotease